MSNNAQPEIRFPGFTEGWEQHKLIEVARYRNGKAHEQAIDESGKYIVVNSKFVSTNGRVKKYTNIIIDPLKKNELAFVLSDVPNGKAIARTFLVDKEHRYSLNQRIAGITPHKDTDSYFLNVLMNRNPYFLKFDNGVGQTNLTKADVENFIGHYPSYEEQQKIGTFFKQLDDTIALHQRKLDLLKETKKGFLQKMFPKNGAKVPEVRFPGFTEDWEERKFGEIVQVSRGLTYKPSDVQIEGIRVLRSSNINEDVFVLRDDDVFVKPDAVNIAPIKNGDILITSANGSSRLVGKHAIVNGLQDKTVHGGFMLRVKSKNTWFTNSLMSSRWYNYFINIYVSGGNGAIGNLRKYDLESQTIIVPDDEEQQKIGAFFKQLDDTIALHQRKLDLLKETKKSFLQKMFV
ncbi:restriction endonuclease subunit S [Enterococcus faecium]|uniref:restriction endonuclease subunit S n=1 Tax=Enterococcus faecium TaxID=1352 RepID=UPI003726D9B9